MVGIKSKLENHGGLYQTENLKSWCVVTYENTRKAEITNAIEVSKMSYHPKKEIKISTPSLNFMKVLFVSS